MGQSPAWSSSDCHNYDSRESNQQMQWLTENKPSFIQKHHVVISHQSPFAANVYPELVAMATSLRPSISAMSSFDSLTRKPLESNSELLAAIHPKLCWFKIYLPHPPHQGDSGSQRWVGEPLGVWYGHSHLGTDWGYCFRFPDFPRIMEWWGILGPKSGKNWSFSPLTFVRGHVRTLL